MGSGSNLQRGTALFKALTRAGSLPELNCGVDAHLQGNRWEAKPLCGTYTAAGGPLGPVSILQVVLTTGEIELLTLRAVGHNPGRSIARECGWKHAVLQPRPQLQENG